MNRNTPCADEGETELSCLLRAHEGLFPRTGMGEPRADLASPSGSGCGCGSCAGGYTPGTGVCGFGVEGGTPAAVFCPLQRFDDLYDNESALRRGTMFQALDKPFYGGKGVDCRGEMR